MKAKNDDGRRFLSSHKNSTSTTSYTYYDDLLQKALRNDDNEWITQYVDGTNVLRIQRRRRTTTGGGGGGDDDDEEEEEEEDVAEITTEEEVLVDGEIFVGKLLGLLPQSQDGNAEGGSLDMTHTGAYFLGVQDFNARRSIFSSDLYDQTTDCNFYFTMSIRDTGRSFFQVGQE